MDATIRAYLRTEAIRAREAANAGKEALVQGDVPGFSNAVKEFVLHRLVLWDTNNDSEEDLLTLAAKSIEHIVALTGGNLSEAGMISGCNGTTTPAYKKVNLLFALQDTFSVRFDPKRTAQLITIDDLCRELLTLRSYCEAKSSASGLIEQMPQRLSCEFPFLAEKRQTIYLDHAATTFVPECVEKATMNFYREACAGVHRGVSAINREATKRYEESRGIVAAYLGAAPDEIVFTSGATAAANLLARAMESRINSGSRVVVTELEHHSNYLPWHELCKRTGAEFAVVPVLSDGQLDEDALERLLSPPTTLFACSHCSNVLGTELPITDLCLRAHRAGITTVIDGAQALAHIPINVKNINCDFYFFSGHKIFAGNGIGVLYGRRDQMQMLSPPAYGGGMVKDINGNDAEWEELPLRWEAGSPNTAGAVALAAALRCRERIGTDFIRAREAALMGRLEHQLHNQPNIRVLGNAPHIGCISFAVKDTNAHDIAAALDLRDIVVRSGQHCAIPLHKSLGISSSVRVSPSVLNSMTDIDRFVAVLHEIVRLL